MQRACKDCEAFNAADSTCRARPPESSVVDGMDVIGNRTIARKILAGTWPRVLADSWCMAFMRNTWFPPETPK